jgi:hypothetical protein
MFIRRTRPTCCAASAYDGPHARQADHRPVRRPRRATRRHAIAGRPGPPSPREATPSRPPCRRGRAGAGGGSDAPDQRGLGHPVGPGSTGIVRSGPSGRRHTTSRPLGPEPGADPAVCPVVHAKLGRVAGQRRRDPFRSTNGEVSGRGARATDSAPAPAAALTADLSRFGMGRGPRCVGDDPAPPRRHRGRPARALAGPGVSQRVAPGSSAASGLR